MPKRSFAISSKPKIVVTKYFAVRRSRYSRLGSVCQQIL